jgi:hypothetical protein
MTLRSIEMIVPEPADGELQELLAEQAVMELNLIGLLNGEAMVRILLEADKSEAVLDILEKQYSDKEDYRIVVLAVEATLPRIEIPEADEKAAKEETPEEKPPKGSVVMSCMTTSVKLRDFPKCISRWRCCRPSWRPSVWSTTASPSSSVRW